MLQQTHTTSDNVWSNTSAHSTTVPYRIHARKMPADCDIFSTVMVPGRLFIGVSIVAWRRWVVYVSLCGGVQLHSHFMQYRSGDSINNTTCESTSCVCVYADRDRREGWKRGRKEEYNQLSPHYHLFDTHTQTLGRRKQQFP